MRLNAMRRCLAWLFLISVSLAVGCARDESNLGTLNAGTRVETMEAANTGSMPPLPQPQSPKLVGSSADVPGTGDAVLRFVRGVAGSYFYAASDADRERIVSSNPDVRFEKALFQVSSPGADGVPVYRFNRSDGSGDFLTSSAQERDAISASRAHSYFHYDGVAFHALPAGRRILSGTETAERQRLEQLEAQLTQALEQRGAVR